MDDGELLKRYVAAGSEEAFRLLVERNLPLVYSAALRKTNNRSMAEDVTQVVFIILRKRRMSFFKRDHPGRMASPLLHPKRQDPTAVKERREH